MSLKIDATTLVNQIGMEQKWLITSISANGVEIPKSYGVDGCPNRIGLEARAVIVSSL